MTRLPVPCPLPVGVHFSENEPFNRAQPMSRSCEVDVDRLVFEQVSGGRFQPPKIGLADHAALAIDRIEAVERRSS